MQDPGSIPDQGTRSHILQLKIPYAAMNSPTPTKTQSSQIKKKKNDYMGFRNRDPTASLTPTFKLTVSLFGLKYCNPEL